MARPNSYGRCMSEGFPAQPGQPHPGQPHPAQPQQPGQPYPGQAYPGQPQPGQPPHPGQPPTQYPGQIPQQPGYQPPPQYPGQIPQQPGFQPPPQQPGGFPAGGPAVQPKKSKLWLWLLLGLGAFVLLIGGCVAVLFNAVKGPIDKSNEFLALVDEGDYQGAFALTDPSCVTGGPETIQSFFGGVDITDYSLTSTSVENNTGSASGTITYNGSDTRTIEFSLTNTDGWRICGFEVGN